MQSVLSRFEPVSPCPFPMTITITPRAPPLTYKLNLKSYGKLHGECEVRRLIPMSAKRHASPDAGRKNPMVNGQDQIVLSENNSYSSIRVVSMDKVKIQPSKDYHDSHSAQVKKRSILVSLELRHQLQNSKHKQKLLKCKSTIHIATFNIRTLNRIGWLLEMTVLWQSITQT